MGKRNLLEFNPGTIKPSDENSGINFDQLIKKYAFESALTSMPIMIYPIK
jgi:hypothetical protein